MVLSARPSFGRNALRHDATEKYSEHSEEGRACNMAGVEWSGCKCKGGTEAKGKMLHFDKEQRLKHGHDNPDIDLSKTPNNFSYYGRSYAQKCRRYDEQVGSAKVKLQRTGKNTNVTMIGLVVYLPKALQKDDEYDPQVVRAWFKDVGDIFKARYGDDFLEMDVHVDEVHPYKDARTKEWEWSRVHGHAAIVPTVTEDGERFLNGKKFASRSAINSLNQAIHEMSVQKYHVPYIDGSGKKGKSASVPQLKARSAKLLMETEAEIEERLSFASDMMLEADAKEQYADQQLDDAAAAQVAAEKRASELDRREAGISAKQRQQDEREKEFQRREDALDAQRVVLEERERAVAERERKNQELIQRGRRAQAEDLSDGIHPADHTEERTERRLPNTDFYN
jgi:hypothetical protein